MEWIKVHQTFNSGYFWGVRWYGLNCVPQNSYVDFLIPITSKCTVFGNRVFIEVVKLK